MAKSDTEKLADAKNSITELNKQIKGVKSKLATSKKDLDQAKVKIKDLEGKQASAEKSNAELSERLDAAPCERFAVVSIRPMRLGGQDIQAGATIGYITTVEGAEPQVVSDAIMHSKARCEPIDESRFEQAVEIGVADQIAKAKAENT